MTPSQLSHFYGYIRVSTAKQGERGVSLQEQRDAIERYALRNGLTISAWFEERETAAKRGRPVFTQMLKLLRQRKVAGLIVHKIDRSARNLKDWADLGDLIDQGITVHFANENLDLHSRGGRLSADIQAVVAADYIRNLREETKKGFYGRIKQGLYPLRAPIGYLDKGKGKPKEIDPVKGPLVKKVFELYGNGRYTLDTLNEELYRLGLRNVRGGRVTRAGLSVLLNNPFYIGIIRLKHAKETFPGIHQPLITKSLFDRVQDILTGKTNTRVQKHDFLFRRLLRCASCSYSLIGSRHKGHVYYRCQTRTCPTTCVREEVVEEAIRQKLLPVQLSKEERRYVSARVLCLKQNWGQERQTQEEALKLMKGQILSRLTRLTDAFVDGSIEKGIYEDRKNTLLLERADVEEQLSQLQEYQGTAVDRLADFLELATEASTSYKVGLPEQKRDLLRIVTSNRMVSGKNVELTLSFPFDEIAKRRNLTECGPERTMPRTWDRLLKKLLVYFQTHSLPMRQDL